MPHFDPYARPTDAAWDSQLEYLDKLWRPAVDVMAELDVIYLQKDDIWEEAVRLGIVKRDARDSIHEGRAKALIDQAVKGHFSLEPTFKRLPATGADDSPAKADRLENGLRVAYNDGLTKATVHPVELNIKQLLIHNHTVKGIFLNERYFAARPKRRQGEDKEGFAEREWQWEVERNTWSPLEHIVPQPGEVLMNPLEKHPRVAFRRKKMKAFEVADLLERRAVRLKGDSRVGRYKDTELGSLGDLDLDADTEFEEWWSGGWYGLRLKGGAILLIERNTRGLQPWSQTWAGSPITPANAEWDLADWVRQSMLYQVKDSLRVNDQAFWAHHTIIMRKATARLGTENPIELAAQSTDGTLAGKKDDIWLELTPDLAPQSFQHKESTLAGIERNTYSLMNSGFRQSGVDTATGILVMSEAGHRMFREVQLQMKGLYSNDASNALKLFYRAAKELGKDKESGVDYATLPMGEHSLNVVDMEDKFHIEVSFQQVDTVVQQAERAAAWEAFERGFIDYETAMKQAGYEDVEGIRERLIKDRVLRDPDVIEQGTINAMREEQFFELADVREKALHQQILARAAQPPPSQGAPGTPQLTNGREAR